MSFNEVIEKVLNILNEFDNAFDLAILVCLTLLNRNVKKGSSSPTVSTSQEVKADLKAIKATKEGFKKEMQAGLDLYYSDKKEEDMTAEEKVLFERVKRYMEDEV